MGSSGESSSGTGHGSIQQTPTYCKLVNRLTVRLVNWSKSSATLCNNRVSECGICHIHHGYIIVCYGAM